MTEEEEIEVTEEELPQTNSKQVKQVVDNPIPELTADSTDGGRNSNPAIVVAEAARSSESPAFLPWLNSANLRKSLLTLLIILVILSVLLLLIWLYNIAFGNAIFKDFITLVSVFISWPVVVIIALLILYKPLSEFLATLGQSNQNVKVSISQFSLEISKASEFTPKWSMSGVDLRFIEGNEIMSSGMPSLFQQFQGNQSLDYAIIDIGDGKQWLTSRLFIFAIMLERMRGLRCLVFVETTPDVRKRFVGIASPGEIRWKLAMLQPWLDPSFAKASFFVQYLGYMPDSIQQFQVPDSTVIQSQYYGISEFVQKCKSMFPDSPLTQSQYHILSAEGALEPYAAESLVRAFLSDPNIQQKGKPSTELDDGNWVEIKRKDKSSFWEHATWINMAWIQKLDLKHDEDVFLESSPEYSRVKQTQAILRRKDAFIALVNVHKEFKELIDRQSSIENVVASLNELSDGRVDDKP